MGMRAGAGEEARAACWAVARAGRGAALDGVVVEGRAGKGAVARAGRGGEAGCGAVESREGRVRDVVVGRGERVAAAGSWAVARAEWGGVVECRGRVQAGVALVPRPWAARWQRVMAREEADGKEAEEAEVRAREAEDGGAREGWTGMTVMQVVRTPAV